VVRPADASEATAPVLETLERHEVLLQAGREFPSLANLVAGEEIRGSWGAHPKSHLIYRVCQDLADHRELPSVERSRARVEGLVGPALLPWRVSARGARAAV